MLLVKCKCGCRFTLDENRNRKHFIQCPNCEEKFWIDGDTRLSELENLLQGVEFVNRIPDNAKISVAFDS